MPPVPFPNIDFDSVAVTPYRHSRLVCGLPEYRKTQQSWGQNFIGKAMAPAGAVAVGQATVPPGGSSTGQNQNVTLLPSGSWYITSWEMAMQFERSEALGSLIPPTGVSGITEFAPGFEVFISQSQIPGVTYDPSIVTLGSYWARKRRAASADWHAELAADRAAFLPPVFPTQNADMRRVAHHLGTLDANQPVYLRFLGPGGPIATQDTILTFYFGGDVTTAWPDGVTTVPGGSFALTLFDDGTAWLQERTQAVGGVPDTLSPWRLVDQWQWEVRGKVQNQQHVIIVIPESNGTLNFIGSGLSHLFRPNSSAITGYSSKNFMTGDGSLRLDMREDLRSPFQFGILTFPVSGLTSAGKLWGYPFRTLFRLSAGAKIFAEIDGLSPHSSGLSVVLFDAKTNEQLGGPAGDGSFATLHASQRDYYPAYGLTEGTDSQWSPFLRGCNFRVEGAIELFTPTSYTGGQVMEVGITGPDTEIDCDTANLLIEDEQQILELGPPGEGGLGSHADVHCQYQTTWDKNDPTKQWILFDGVVSRAALLRTGRNGPWGYPSAKWKTIRLQLAGQWHRLSEPWQHVWQARDFTSDPAAGIDPLTGRNFPWAIVDIIKEMLRQAGYDSSQMQILNPVDAPTPPRLFANGNNPEDYWIHPGTRLADAIHHMCKDYLGCRLIWDKEALPNGRWLTVYPPALSGGYTTLYTFRTDSPPGSSGLPVHLPQAYPDGSTFVTNYSKWVTPPEANLFIVATAPVGIANSTFDPLDPVGSIQRFEAKQLCAAIGVNWRSTFFEGYPPPDPTSLDWVPYGIKPSITVDPALYLGSVEKSNEACRYRCRRQMMLGAYGLQWFQWLAPLIGYFDPDPIYGGGPRSFRTYDLVTFNEDGVLQTVMLTSCNPAIGLPEGDLFQQAEHTGFVLPEPLSY